MTKEQTLTIEEVLNNIKFNSNFSLSTSLIDSDNDEKKVLNSKWEDQMKL